jgi:hypothetical protein
MPRSSPLRRLIERGFDMIRLASLIALLLATSPVAAQTAGTSTSQLCTQDPTYCSDTGATSSTTTSTGTSSSASSGGSGGGSSGGGSSGSSSGSSGAGAGGPLAIPNSPCGDGFPADAWGGCNECARRWQRISASALPRAGAFHRGGQRAGLASLA